MASKYSCCHVGRRPTAHVVEVSVVDMVRMGPLEMFATQVAEPGLLQEAHAARPEMRHP